MVSWNYFPVFLVVLIFYYERSPTYVNLNIKGSIVNETNSVLQSVLRKIRCHLEEKVYKKLHTTGSKPGLFYGTAKVHKLKIGEGLKELFVRPIISNTGIATYKRAKYLNTLLASLTKLQYNILSTDAFIQKIKNERIPKWFEMISFDLKNLFTNVPLHQTK